MNFGRNDRPDETKEFASESEADKSFNKLIGEKLKKGYVEKTAQRTLRSLFPRTKECLRGVSGGILHRRKCHTPEARGSANVEVS